MILNDTLILFSGLELASDRETPELMSMVPLVLTLALSHQPAFLAQGTLTGHNTTLQMALTASAQLLVDAQDRWVPCPPFRGSNLLTFTRIFSGTHGL